MKFITRMVKRISGQDLVETRNAYEKQLRAANMTISELKTQKTQVECELKRATKAYHQQTFKTRYWKSQLELQIASSSAEIQSIFQKLNSKNDYAVLTVVCLTRDYPYRSIWNLYYMCKGHVHVTQIERSANEKKENLFAEVLQAKSLEKYLLSKIS